MKQKHKGSIAPTEAEMLWRYVKRVESGCWEWQGQINHRGYGHVNHVAIDTRMAHRAVYELIVGPIPDGLQIDHLCRNKACVNPSHLEPVTASENMRRSIPDRIRTHCYRGHLFTEENTVYMGGRRPSRTCRICWAAAVRRGNERKKAKRAL